MQVATELRNLSHSAYRARSNGTLGKYKSGMFIITVSNHDFKAEMMHSRASHCLQSINRKQCHPSWLGS